MNKSPYKYDPSPKADDFESWLERQGRIEFIEDQKEAGVFSDVFRLSVCRLKLKNPKVETGVFYG